MSHKAIAAHQSKLVAAEPSLEVDPRNDKWRLIDENGVKVDKIPSKLDKLATTELLPNIKEGSTVLISDYKRFLNAALPKIEQIDKVILRANDSDPFPDEFYPILNELLFKESKRVNHLILHNTQMAPIEFGLDFNSLETFAINAHLDTYKINYENLKVLIKNCEELEFLKLPRCSDLGFAIIVNAVRRRETFRMHAVKDLPIQQAYAERMDTQHFHFDEKMLVVMIGSYVDNMTMNHLTAKRNALETIQVYVTTKAALCSMKPFFFYHINAKSVEVYLPWYIKEIEAFTLNNINAEPFQNMLERVDELVDVKWTKLSMTAFIHDDEDVIRLRRGVMKFHRKIIDLEELNIDIIFRRSQMQNMPIAKYALDICGSTDYNPARCMLTCTFSDE